MLVIVSRQLEGGVGLEGLLSGGDGDGDSTQLPALTGDFAGTGADDDDDVDHDDIIDAEFTVRDAA